MAQKFTLPSRRNIRNRRTWHGMAFIMESLLLVVFLIASTAILMQVFSVSHSHGNQAYALSYAVTLASNEAERFSVKPRGNTVEYYALENDALVAANENTHDAYRVTRSTEQQKRSNGVLYRATIVVEQKGEQLYKINTSRYVGNSEVVQ